AVVAGLVVQIVRYSRTSRTGRCRVPLAGHAIQGVIAVINRLRNAGIRLIRRRGGLTENVPSVVISVIDGSGFRVDRYQELRERIVGEGAGTPLRGVRRAALLIDTGKVPKHVVQVVSFIIQSVWVFKDLGHPINAIGARLARFLGLVAYGRAI